ncbi:hypothetical protein HHL16_24700 [Pseudoflavitalea sp. G-6-1-2]|uniref:hypothetical protein n=1 Tax=Pseudoflavitalea sp. G-6-1-2 TaxID=2728841 RepID=UPI00146CAABB|nr:hypothetical protein [Pseudoflavitalea sp. G-6-1-2]NML24101.1 hypothetical protein [Pseudoflavitalea sp. G-6-1-2]
MLSLFRKKRTSGVATTDFISLINRRAEDFRAFYTERFGNKLNYQFSSLPIIDMLLAEARNGAATADRRLWLAVYGSAYLYRIASLRISEFQYIWYHPLDQPMMLVGSPNYRISLLAQEAVTQRLADFRDISLQQLFINFETALVYAKKGDDILFV